MTLTHTHILPILTTLENALSPQQQADKLRVRYDRALSQQVSDDYSHAVSVYLVTNLSKQLSTYQVRLYARNGKKFAECECEARKICKHIVRAVALHVARITAQQAADKQMQQTAARATRAAQQVVMRHAANCDIYIDAFCEVCSARETDTRDNLQILGWILNQREQFCPAHAD